jgi:hypothetical protein
MFIGLLALLAAIGVGFQKRRSNPKVARWLKSTGIIAVFLFPGICEGTHVALPCPGFLVLITSPNKIPILLLSYAFTWLFLAVIASPLLLTRLFNPSPKLYEGSEDEILRRTLADRNKS